MPNFSTALEFDLWSTTRVPTAVGGVPRGVFVDEDGNPQIVAGGRTLGISRFGDMTAADIVLKREASIGVEGEFALVIGAAVAKGAELAAQVATGRGITAVSTNFVGAIALEAGAANGDVIRARRVNYYKP